MCWSGGVSLWTPSARDLLLLPPLLLLLILSVQPTVIHAERQSTYRTAYACEGMELNIECETGHVINVIRANYGRFSITICNTHGNTEWSVNCQSVRTQGVLADRCSGQSSCNMSVSSENFEDPCPGTFKYIEVHYACGPATATTTTARPRPPWLHTTRQPIWLPPALVTNFTTTSKPTTPITTTSTTTTTTTTTLSPTTTFPPVTSPEILLDDNQVGVRITQEEKRPTTRKSVVADTAVAATSSSTAGTPITLNITTPRYNLPPLAPPAVGATDNGYDSPWCPPSFVRGLLWKWTRGGEIAVQPCPGGALGWARRTCLIKGWENHSDLSECRSVWLNTMESRVEAKDSLLNIANDLATFTGSKVLYGGDLTTASRLLSTLSTNMVDNIQTIPDSLQRQALVTEMLQAVLTTSSSLLAGGITGAWGDLSVKERHHAVTQLMVALEEAAFLLADAIPPDTEVAHFKSHVLASVRSAVGHGMNVNFPSVKDQTMDWSFADSISLPPEAILENSNRGVTSVVFLTYRHLEDLLAPGNEVLGTTSSGWDNTSRFVNSRVVSASLGHGRHIQLPEPVTITFALLRLENVSKPICVFWDYTTAAWSGEGCLVLSSNYTHVSCQCDHLTNFAVLMEESTGQSMEDSQTALRILGYVGCAVALLFLIGSLLVFSVFRSLHSPRTAVHRHVCICLSLTELVFVFGVWKTSNTVLCGIVAGVLHYTLLAAFAWMFIEGVHVYLSVARTVESDSIRLRWWHYLLAYGLPLLVVFAAAIIDPFSYGTQSYCLLRTDNYFIFSLVGPVLLLVLAHLTLLAVALIYVCKLVPDDSLKTKEMSRLDSTRSWLHGSFTLLFLMVLNWTLGLLFIHTPSLPIAAAFCVVNALHGFAIFIYYCFRNQKAFGESRCGVNESDHIDGAWLPQVMRGMFVQDKQTYSTNTNTSNNIPNPAITHALTHALSNNHQPTVPNFNQYLPNLCQVNGMKSSEMRMGEGVGGSQVGGSISMNGDLQSRGHLPFGALHQSLPHHHTLSMARTSTTTNPSIHHAMLNGKVADVPYKSSWDSGPGGSEPGETPHTAWNNAHVNHYSNSLTSDHKNVYLDNLNSINAAGGIDGNHYPHIDGNRLITVPNSYISQLSPAAVPPAVAAMLRGNTNTVCSHSPSNHTYMEIGTESSDPVYEEIERERYLNHGGQIIPSVGFLTGGEAMQVSGLSDEDIKCGTPTDMSCQSSHSYGDARPLLPYLSQQMTHPRSLEEQFSLSEERLRDFNAAQISLDLEQLQQAQQQYNHDNLMTVAVLNGEQVVCRLTSPSTPHQPQSLPVIHETCRGGVMVSQPLTNGYPAHLVISHPQHVIGQQFSEC